MKVWTRKVQRGGARSLMEEVLERARSSAAEVLVMDGCLVFGSDHLGSALTHASKAIEEGRNSSESLAMETLLYASGERQLSTAIKKMSVGDATEEVAVALLSGDFSPGEGWSALPEMQQDPDHGRLVRFGVTEREMDTVPRSRLSELVLERVAAVDVIKR